MNRDSTNSNGQQIITSLSLSDNDNDEYVQPSTVLNQPEQQEQEYDNDSNTILQESATVQDQEYQFQDNVKEIQGLGPGSEEETQVNYYADTNANYDDEIGKPIEEIPNQDNTIDEIHEIEAHDDILNDDQDDNNNLDNSNIELQVQNIEFEQNGELHDHDQPQTEDDYVQTQDNDQPVGIEELKQQLQHQGEEQDIDDNHSQEHIDDQGFENEAQLQDHDDEHDDHIDNSNDDHINTGVILHESDANSSDHDDQSHNDEQQQYIVGQAVTASDHDEDHDNMNDHFNVDEEEHEDVIQQSVKVSQQSEQAAESNAMVLDDDIDHDHDFTHSADNHIEDESEQQENQIQPQDQIMIEQHQEVEDTENRDLSWLHQHEHEFEVEEDEQDLTPSHSDIPHEHDDEDHDVSDDHGEDHAEAYDFQRNNDSDDRLPGASEVYNEFKSIVSSHIEQDQQDLDQEQLQDESVHEEHDQMEHHDDGVTDHDEELEPQQVQIHEENQDQDQVESESIQDLDELQPIGQNESNEQSGEEQDHVQDINEHDIVQNAEFQSSDEHSNIQNQQVIEINDKANKGGDEEEFQYQQNQDQDDIQIDDDEKEEEQRIQESNLDNEVQDDSDERLFKFMRREPSQSRLRQTVVDNDDTNIVSEEIPTEIQEKSDGSDRKSQTDSLRSSSRNVSQNEKRSTKNGAKKSQIETSVSNSQAQTLSVKKDNKQKFSKSQPLNPKRATTATTSNKPDYQFKYDDINVAYNFKSAPLSQMTMANSMQQRSVKQSYMKPINATNQLKIPIEIPEEHNDVVNHNEHLGLQSSGSDENKKDLKEQDASVDEGEGEEDVFDEENLAMNRLSNSNDIPIMIESDFQQTEEIETTPQIVTSEDQTAGATDASPTHTSSTLESHTNSAHTGSSDIQSYQIETSNKSSSYKQNTSRSLSQSNSLTQSHGQSQTQSQSLTQSHSRTSDTSQTLSISGLRKSNASSDATYNANNNQNMDSESSDSKIRASGSKGKHHHHHHHHQGSQEQQKGTKHHHHHHHKHKSTNSNSNPVQITTMLPILQTNPEVPWPGRIGELDAIQLNGVPNLKTILTQGENVARNEYIENSIRQKQIEEAMTQLPMPQEVQQLPLVEKILYTFQQNQRENDPSRLQHLWDNRGLIQNIASSIVKLQPGNKSQTVSNLLINSINGNSSMSNTIPNQRMSTQQQQQAQVRSSAANSDPSQIQNFPDFQNPFSNAIDAIQRQSGENNTNILPTNSNSLGLRASAAQKTQSNYMDDEEGYIETVSTTMMSQRQAQQLQYQSQSMDMKPQRSSNLKQFEKDRNSTVTELRPVSRNTDINLETSKWSQLNHESDQFQSFNDQTQQSTQSIVLNDSDRKSISIGQQTQGTQPQALINVHIDTIKTALERSLQASQDDLRQELQSQSKQTNQSILEIRQVLEAIQGRLQVHEELLTSKPIKAASVTKQSNSASAQVDRKFQLNRSLNLKSNTNRSTTTSTVPIPRSLGPGSYLDIVKPNLDQFNFAESIAVAKDISQFSQFHAETQSQYQSQLSRSSSKDSSYNVNIVDDDEIKSELNFNGDTSNINITGTIELPGEFDIEEKQQQYNVDDNTLYLFKSNINGEAEIIWDRDQGFIQQKSTNNYIKPSAASSSSLNKILPSTVTKSQSPNSNKILTTYEKNFAQQKSSSNLLKTRNAKPVQSIPGIITESSTSTTAAVNQGHNHRSSSFGPGVITDMVQNNGQLQLGKHIQPHHYLNIDSNKGEKDHFQGLVQGVNIQAPVLTLSPTLAPRKSQESSKSLFVNIDQSNLNTNLNTNLNNCRLSFNIDGPRRAQATLDDEANGLPESGNSSNSKLAAHIKSIELHNELLVKHLEQKSQSQTQSQIQSGKSLPLTKPTTQVFNERDGHLKIEQKSISLMAKDAVLNQISNMKNESDMDTKPLIESDNHNDDEVKTSAALAIFDESHKLMDDHSHGVEKMHKITSIRNAAVVKSMPDENINDSDDINVRLSQYLYSPNVISAESESRLSSYTNYMNINKADSVLNQPLPDELFKVSTNLRNKEISDDFLKGMLSRENLKKRKK